MNGLVDPEKHLKEQISHLQKRETRISRDLVAATRRVEVLEGRVEKLTQAIRTGLPHMNLSEFIDG